MYPGTTAYEYYMWNREGHIRPNPASCQEWFEVCWQGMPQTVNECKNICKVISNTKAKKEDRFEAWLLLTEFYHVANCFTPIQHDHVMQWTIEHMGRLHRPVPWQNFQLFLLDPAAFNPPRSDIHNPDANLTLIINPWAQVILHHGQPRLHNAHFGIIIDCTFHISQ